MPLIIILVTLMHCQEMYSFFSSYSIRKQLHVVLDPAGDAHRPGRLIGSTTERSVTLQLATHIKNRLETGIYSPKVFITREPGQTIQPLHVAQFSNRLSADVHIALSCYHENGIRPTITLYHLLWHPTTDYWYKPSPGPHLLPVAHAYLPQLKKTTHLGSVAAQFCAVHAPKHGFITHGCFGIPTVCLVGCLAPALNIEFGFRTEHEWHAAVSLAADLIQTLIDQLAS